MTNQNEADRGQRRFETTLTLARRCQICDFFELDELVEQELEMVRTSAPYSVEKSHRFRLELDVSLRAAIETDASSSSG